MDLVMEDLQADGSEPIYPPLHYAEKTLEFCFTHSNSRYGETFYSFVNGQYTSDGGTHLSAFREGLLKAVNEYCHEKFDGDDVREMHGRRGVHPAEGPGVRVADQEQAGQHGNPHRAGQPRARGTAALLQPQQGHRREDHREGRRTRSSCARNCRRSRSWRANGPRPSPSASRSSRIARTTSTRPRDKGKRHDGLHHAKASPPPARS